MRHAVHRKESEAPEAHLAGALLELERHLQAVGESTRARRFAELRSGLGQPDLRVVVFGEFNRGKSTLINALLGRIVLPAKLIPTTGHVTQVVYGHTERVRVRFLDGREETFGLDRLDSISSLDLGGAAREDVELLEVAVDDPLLRRKVDLIDTPGLNEKAAQTRRARSAIARADLVLLVLDARNLLSLRERDLAIEWLSESLGKPVVLVVNFMNLLNDPERAEVRARLATWTRGRIDAVWGRPWFEVDARSALLHGLSEGAAPTDDFALLRDALAACEGTARAAIQHRGRYGQLLAEVREAQTENAGLLRHLQEDVAAVEGERATRRTKLAERIRQLTADAAVRREGILLAARQSLSSRLPDLMDLWLKNASRERLTEDAKNWYGWYEIRLFEAVAEIEAHAAAALSALLEGGTGQDAPLTIRERLVLSARNEHSLADAASASASNWGMGVGALLGTIFLSPGVGTAIGAAVGRWLGGRSAVDPVSQFADRAREQWAADAQKVMTLLAGQVDARIVEGRSELARHLEAVQQITAGHALTRGEVEHRETLDAALSLCQDLLQAD